jgi:hypothetical protein
MWWSGSLLQSHEVFAKQSGGQENPPSPLLGATGNQEAGFVPGLILADALFAIFLSKQLTCYFFEVIWSEHEDEA